jgi:hypothetical protein
MVNIILVDKSGDLKLCKYNVDKGDELYKKCKFKKQDNFEKRTTWKTKKNKYDFSSVSLYSRDTGKANTENKYDFPPPVDTPLYFGVCALVANDENDDCIDLSIEAWETFYEELFGGFENLADTAAEDNNEEDELESIPAEMKTKSGYLKDDFVVEDNQVENGSTESDEEEYDDDSAELELEEYSYSDEEESN